MPASNAPWYQSNKAVLAACLLFPPAGLVFLWSKPRLRWWKRAALSLPVIAIGFAHLVYLYGLRIEVDGTGIKPIFSFRSPEANMAALEQHRQAQSMQTPLPAPEVVQAAPAQAAPPPFTAYWADFRGPNRDGRFEQSGILTSWPPSGLERLWKQPSGGGYASFALANGVAYTIEQRRGQEVTAAYDIRTGREKWTNSWDAHFQESMGGPGPRATPVWNDGRLYTQGAEGELRCLDAATGSVIWRKNILEEAGASNIQWAMANAPLIVDGKVIVLPGGRGGKSVVAYDKLSGKPVWSALDDQASYTSPVMVTLAGKRQLLVVTASRAVGLTIEEGRLLWEFPWSTMYDINSAQPIIVAPNRFFISAGYGHGAAVVELSPRGDAFQAKTVWQNTKMKNKFNSSILHDGHIYGLDEGILACVNAATGDLKWKGGRYGYGQLIYASGHLIVLTEEGDLVLVKAAPDAHKEVSKFSAIEGKTWNHPAIADGFLLVRNESQMACFRVGR
jgi:outer membrane protein assembly factor BamB